MGLKHQAASARKWRAAIRQVERHFPAHLPPLLFLTDPQRTPDPMASIQTLPAGAGVIYRHFGAENRETTARALRAECNQRNLVLFIAADPGLAKTVQANGVHWPEARLAEALKWRGLFQIQTASAHSSAALARAARAGMDAALVSAVFPSNSPSASAPIGTARLRMRACKSAMPIYALGGVNAVTAQRIASVAGLAGIDGLSA